MRISDWSSDVCSSDLAEGGRQPACATSRCTRPRADELPDAGRSRRAARTLYPAARADRPAGGDREGRSRASAVVLALRLAGRTVHRSEEHTSELQSLMRISYAVFCLKKNKSTQTAHIQK